MIGTAEDVLALGSLRGRRVWVAGHRGMVGSAVVRRLAHADCELLTVGREALDLRRQAEVERWVERARPDVIVVAAATVGGILANATYPATFLYDNLMIAMNIMHAARGVGAGRLMFLGSSCIYPKLAEQPLREDSILTGPLEPTNEAYAVAKIAGIKLAAAMAAEHGCNFFSAMPTNLYGPGDRYDLKASHVIPALMIKIETAKRQGRDVVELWGSGAPLREFMHVDDFADAAVFLLERHAGNDLINVGTGEEISIRGLAELLAEVMGFKGRFAMDASKPDGTPRKLLDSSRLAALGWRPRIKLRDGLAATYAAWRDEMARGVVAAPVPELAPA